MNSNENIQDTEQEPNGGCTAQEADLSCRSPVLYLVVSAAFWLVVSSLFGLIATLKFHAPGFLADIPWLTYGRVWPVAWNALIYGFAVPLALGVSLWMLVRLVRQTLVLPWMIWMGTLFWNIGTLIGLVGILSGLTTGYHWLEMPRYTSLILFVCYAFIAIPLVITFAQRERRELFPSAWFLFIALFWFPWIYLAASYLLNFAGVRGVMQAVVDYWYVHNLATVYFGLIGLGIILYFAARVAERPLFSRYLVMLVLFLFTLFGSWGDVPRGAPVPAWLPNLSATATLFVLLALVAFLKVLNRTLSGSYRRFFQSWHGRFLAVGTIAFVAITLLDFITAFFHLGSLVGLTLYTQAEAMLRVYGFFAMLLFGAVYWLVPRVAQQDWPYPKLVGAHFTLVTLGLVVYVVPLAMGGIGQGKAMQDPDIQFMQVLDQSLMYYRVSTLGDVLLLLGHGVFFLNAAVLYYRHACAAWVNAIASAARPAETVEVNA